MDKALPWMAALGVKQADVDRWCRELPKDKSLTSWCLETGKISADDYLSWAKNHYGLAHLKSDFFLSEPNHEFWKGVQDTADWSPECVPVAHWDDTVFVACVEPQAGINLKTPLRFVLANPKDLKQYWIQLNSSKEATFIGIPPTPDKQTRTSIPIPQELPPPSITEPVTEPVDEPAGLKVDAIKVESANSTPDFMAQLSQQVSSGDSPPDLDAPANLVWKPKAADENILAPEGLSASIASEVPSPGASTDAPMNIPPTPEVSTKISTMPEIPAAAKSNSNDPISIIKIEFSGVMVLEVNGDHATPVMWDEHFKKPAQNPGITLNQPSAFRVATRTKLPYLGHVVDTPINKQLFESWGFTTMPDRIAIQPVLKNGVVKQLLLAIPVSTMKNHYVLSAIEKAAALLSPSVSKNAA